MITEANNVININHFDVYYVRMIYFLKKSCLCYNCGVISTKLEIFS